MLFKSTFLQSSSIWKVMSALFITVLDALGQINRQYYTHEHTHIPYQLCLFIWILLKNIQSTIATWHRWFNDVCRFRIWENLLDTANIKGQKTWLVLLMCQHLNFLKMLTIMRCRFHTYIQIWYSSGFQEGREVLFLATHQAVWQIFG